ncbi:energy transducer TonB [candidate division KSB1 bacterium]|nr:energy transducer TonB [candidate division KSB1 bacterium]
MKKSADADLRIKYRKLMELGMIGSLTIVLLGFLGFRGGEFEKRDLDIPDQIIKMEEIPQTEQVKRQPPPPRPSVAIPTEDEDVPDDETIEETDINFDEIPPPPEEPPVDESAQIFVAFDTAPAPIGGFAAIQKKLVYPDIARKAGIEGRVIVNVLVGTDGTVKDTKILKSLGHTGCDEAAIDAIKAVRWTPAKQRDRAVQVWVGIPVIFKLK